mgnify:CR=1 FL=1
MNENEFAELSAGHALDALSVEDEQAYQQALAAHPEWEELVDADAQVAGFLAEGTGEEAPPVEVRARLLAQISAMPQRMPDPADAAPGRPAGTPRTRARSPR